MKYEEIVCALPTEYATKIQDLLLDPPEEELYKKLKQQLITRKLMKSTKSNGFPLPSAHVTYTHGNNVGNLTFGGNPRG